ncbi:MAG: siphovirus Gp157 family protein [Rhizobiaceae bacterium]
MYHQSSVGIEVARYSELRRRIEEIEPDIDDRTLLDTLEGATDLNEAITQIIRSAMDDGMMVAALKARLGEMRERLERLQAREKAKRDLALEAMQQVGLNKIQAPDCTISQRQAPPSLVVEDETQVPEWFWIPQAAKLDKRAIIDCLKAGDAVSGAVLADPSTILSVRTR